ncbi:MAG: hypothetical protein IT204_13475 [Fimbriimonadaceae bacterium]|nr:hypothetical protein [Fimbriimonadaceae bacterium]
MAELLMVGSVAYDSVETPHGKVTQALGGAASYAGVAASFLAPARIVGVVGEDFEQAHLDFFTSRGLDLAGLQRVPGQTFHWGGRYEQNMNVRTTLFTHLNVFEDFNPVLPERYRSSDYVLLANIHPALQLQVLDQMTSPKFVALDTMNLWIDIARDTLGEVMRRVQMLLVNDEEARQLTGLEDNLAAAEGLLELGPEVVIVKKGEHGAMMLTRDWSFLLPGYPVTTVQDPTGCGDCFAGGLLGYLAAADRTAEATLRTAMAYGTTIASFNVEAFSLDRLRTLDRAQIDQRCRALRALTAFEV